MIKNPSWREATSWLVTKRGRVKSGTTGNKSKPEIRTQGNTPKPMDHSASAFKHDNYDQYLIKDIKQSAFDLTFFTFELTSRMLQLTVERIQI